MNKETEPRDGGFTEEELKNIKKQNYYNEWIAWWQEMLSRPDSNK